MDPESIRKSVRERYGKLATMHGNSDCGGGSGRSCCIPGMAGEAELGQAIGYSEKEMSCVPEGANLGLGCGNPQSIAALQAGETILDLGSGAGFDCFLAAGQVGPQGRVIGVDMTPEMIARARLNASQNDPEPYPNVEFRLGEIEHLPVADSSVDVIISNCVINLSADKQKVFEEAYRVLKPGGRMAILDILAVGMIPEEVQNDLAAISACLGGAMTVDHIERLLRISGFENIRIEPREESRHYINKWLEKSDAGSYVRSATIAACKPQDAIAGHEPGTEKKPAIEKKILRKSVYQEFKDGKNCAETVSKTVLDIFSSRPVVPAVQCAAGFGGGIADTFEEVCGALSGGVIALGHLLARGESDANRQTLLQLTGQFRQRFLAEFGSTHCRTLRRGFEKKNESLGCVRLSAKAAVILADMLYCFESDNDAPIESWIQTAAGNGAADACPFHKLIG